MHFKESKKDKDAYQNPRTTLKLLLLYVVNFCRQMRPLSEVETHRDSLTTVFL